MTIENINAINLLEGEPHESLGSLEVGYLIVEVWGDAEHVRLHDVYMSLDAAQEAARKIESDTGNDVHIECVDVHITTNAEKRHKEMI